MPWLANKAGRHQQKWELPTGHVIWATNLNWMNESDWSAKTSSAVKCSSRGNKRSVWHCSVHWKKSVERRFFCKKFSYDGGLEIKGPHPPESGILRANASETHISSHAIQSWWNLSIPTFREGRKAPSEIHQTLFFFSFPREIFLAFFVFG